MPTRPQWYYALISRQRGGEESEKQLLLEKQLLRSSHFTLRRQKRKRTSTNSRVGKEFGKAAQTKLKLERIAIGDPETSASGLYTVSEECEWPVHHALCMGPELGRSVRRRP